MSVIDIRQEELDSQIEQDSIVRSIKEDLEYWEKNKRERTSKLREKINDLRREVGVERKKIGDIKNVIRHLYSRISALQEQGKSKPARKCALQQKLWARMRIVRKRIIAEHARRAAKEAMKNLRFI